MGFSLAIDSGWFVNVSFLFFFLQVVRFISVSSNNLLHSSIVPDYGSVKQSVPTRTGEWPAL